MNMTEQTQTETATAPTDPWAMTGEQVTAKLKAMTADYERSKRSDDPHSKLRDRYDGHKARFDNLTGGGSAKEREKFDALMKEKFEADPVAVGMSGDIGDVPSSEVKQIAIGANWLREVGLPEQAIHDYIAGAPVEQSFHDQVAAWKSRSMKDGAFVKAYLDKEDAKHSEAVRQMLVANAVLISPIKEDAA
jgi:hypothetical protein